MADHARGWPAWLSAALICTRQRIRNSHAGAYHLAKFHGRTTRGGGVKLMAEACSARLGSDGADVR
jgi:hypothetical protein